MIHTSRRLDGGNSCPRVFVSRARTLKRDVALYLRMQLPGAQNSQGGNSRNVTTLDWAKLAKR